jgi:hypothetical protein
MVVLNAGPPLVVDSPLSPATHITRTGRGRFSHTYHREQKVRLAPRTSGVHVITPFFWSPEVLTLCIVGALALPLALIHPPTA